MISSNPLRLLAWGDLSLGVIRAAPHAPSDNLATITPYGTSKSIRFRWQSPLNDVQSPPPTTGGPGVIDHRGGGACVADVVGVAQSPVH